LTRESSRGGESVSSVRANQDKDPMPPRGKPISCHSSRIQEWANSRHLAKVGTLVLTALLALAAVSAAGMVFHTLNRQDKSTHQSISESGSILNLKNRLMKESTTQKTIAPTTRSQAPVPSERPKIPLMDTAITTGPRRSRINSRENRTLLDILDYKMKTKVQEIDRTFRQRFPRDNRKSSHRRYYVPRRKDTAFEETDDYLGDDPQTGLTDQEMVEELIYSLDEDGDGLAGPWEIHDWILWVEDIFHQHEVDNNWHSLSVETQKDDSDDISWSDYQSKVNPHGIQTAKQRRRETQERRRWNHADDDGNDKLNKKEYKFFLFPQLFTNLDGTGDRAGGGGIMVMEAFDNLDTDLNGRISQAEFMAQFDHGPEEVMRRRSDEEGEGIDQGNEARLFRDSLDTNSDGWLDLEEMAEYVEPTGFVQAKSEVVYLFQLLDEDRSLDISPKEIMNRPQAFLSSQVTQYGRIYSQHGLRRKVFQFPLSTGDATQLNDSSDLRNP